MPVLLPVPRCYIGQIPIDECNILRRVEQEQSQLFAPRALSVSFTNRAVDDTGGTSTAGGPDVYNLFFSAFPARATAAAALRPVVRSRGLIRFVLKFFSGVGLLVFFYRWQRL